MNLPENPTWRVFVIVVASIMGLVGLSYLLLIGLLVGVSLPDPNHKQLLPEWTNTTEVYLRNRTAAPLLVTLTVPRAALRLDTIWWGVAMQSDAIGRGLVADSLLVPGLRYRLPAPALVEGSADTLVATSAANVPGLLLGRRKFFNPWGDLPHWTALMRQLQPDFTSAVRVQPLAQDGDSLRLVLVVAPDSALQIGYQQTEYFSDGTPLEPNFYAHQEDGARYPTPVPRVQWLDGQHHWRQHRPPLARWLKQPAGPTASQTTNSRQRQYKEYR